ncbi:hypothetical protein [Novosphingobium sp.]|uniref:hypothetical protein n=1 Tax=Novosphingobium sp. TaxID=1874826 RepID=UPI00286E00B4|nr:hypothetical protein [Novosphingobium sp.]
MNEARGAHVVLGRLGVEMLGHAVDGPVDVIAIGIGFGACGQCLLAIGAEVAPVDTDAVGVDIDEVDLVE